MLKTFLYIFISFLLTFSFCIPPVAAKQVNKDITPAATLFCFSGGQEIIQKNVLAGPFADEYKFAHEVEVSDETGEYRLNFSGGLCIIDQGLVSVKKELKLTDELSCYSGATKVVNFQVYGPETTIDEYLEGRTFIAKAEGNYLNSDSIHRYLIFGGATCIGEEKE